MRSMFTIELGGKHRVVRYDMNAIAALEEKLGETDVISHAFTGGFKARLAFVWAGLIWETWDTENDCPTLKLKAVGDLLTPLLKDPKQYNAIMEECALAFAAAFPDPPKPEEGEPKNVQSAAAGE